ncbi:hypothetical protein F6X40_10055 [Paraburkholderia sp. UCT31]|uniref:hypothetical protein n=1 Tax=Paraburkholderia sp. UCT31 TaxID=2615209 RepID=UPI00165628E6|nr:hypothetical protein [Paraburkholderia sp. UCT31]MBC8737150.1 hypothetical protein [Paraburkholderia sp. UCT31]
MSIKNYPRLPRLYFDLDGVLADLESGAKHHGLPPSEAKRKVGFYRDLPLVAHAQEAVHELRRDGWPTWALTKIPDSNPFSATEKLLWTRESFQAFNERIVITPDKGAVGTPDDWLIEDRPGHANAHAFAGYLVHFGSPDAPDWPTVVQFFRKVRAQGLSARDLKAEALANGTYLQYMPEEERSQRHYPFGLAPA